MNKYDIGDVALLTAAFATSAGTPTDPTSVVVKVKKPDASETTHADVVRDSAGNYHYELYVDSPGTWAYRWVGDGAPGTLRAASEGKLSVKQSAFATP